MKSYFKFLSRNRLYTLITVAGMALSLMFVILMGDYTWRQYSIDRWHKNADRICLMGDRNMFYMWPQAAGDIRKMCPEVEQTCCVLSQKGKIKYGTQEVSDGENENGIILLTDAAFFSMFDFDLVRGDRRHALDAPDKCVITERLAQRLFGDKDPIGEPLQIVGERHVRIGQQGDPYDSTLVYTVSAVAKNLDHTVLPNETQIILSMKRYPQVMGYELMNNAFAYGPTGAIKVFLELRPGTTLDGKKEMIAQYLKKNYPYGWGDNELTLTPLTDILFAPQNDSAGIQKGDKTRLHILFAAVLAILFFAVSNYINLTMANTGFRAKEMATRRLFGSGQHEISLKLIGESTLMVAVSFVIGFGLALCFQEDAAALFKGKIALMSDVNPGTVSVSIGFILLTGFLSGILPSWQIARYQPIDVVKGNFRFHSKMVLGRLFIILQNVITVVMFTAALVIWLQLYHLIHAPLGYNTENLYYLYCPEGKEQTSRNMLEKMPFVEEIGQFQQTSFTNLSWSARTFHRGDKEITVMLSDMDKVAFRLYGLKIIEDYGPTDGGYYLTEEAMRQLGCAEKDREIDWGEGEKIPIAGVIRDFHRGNVLQDVEPFAIRVQDELLHPFFLVKTNGDKQANGAFIDMLRKMGVPDSQVKWYYCSMQDSIAETFEEQQNTLHIITLFSFVAVLISVMGFVGLSLFFIRQRQKEIGIRKIMGSTSIEAVWLMLRTFCGPLLLSFVMAVPLSWYIMYTWLSGFSSRVALSPWIFVATCLFSLLVALFSVGIQIVRAVRENPVESIKTE